MLKSLKSRFGTGPRLDQMMGHPLYILLQKINLCAVVKCVQKCVGDSRRIVIALQKSTKTKMILEKKFRKFSENVVGRNKFAENHVRRNKVFHKTQKHTLKVKNRPIVPYISCLIHQYSLYNEYHHKPIIFFLG